MADRAPGMNTTSTTDANQARLRRRQWRLLVGAVLLLAGVMAGYFYYLRNAAAPPAFDVTDLEPAAAAALDEARRAVIQEPRSADAWGRLGLLLQAYEFPDPALFCFAQADRFDPREPRWPVYQGIVLAQTDAAGAIAHWQRALDQGGQSESLHLRLANALLEQGRLDEAQQHLQQLLRLDPVWPPALLALGRVVCARGEWREALTHLRLCSDDPTTRKSACTLMAAAYQRLGESAAAEQELNVLAHLPPDAAWPDPFADELAAVRVDRQSRLQFANRLQIQGRLPEALSVLAGLVRDYPDYTLARRAQGYVQMQCGDLAGAEQTLQVAFEQAPDSAETLFYLGCVAMNRRQGVAAVDYLRRATALKPDHAMAYFNLGRCFRLQGDAAAAIQAFRQAVRCRPYLAEAHHYLGELLAQTGKPAEAIEHLHNAVELDPGDQKSQELLKRLKR